MESDVFVSGRSTSSNALKNAPPARPAGFHHDAVASSATAVKAPPIPWARTPITSVVCADAAGVRKPDRRATNDADARNDTAPRETLSMSPSLAAFVDVLWVVRRERQPTSTAAATTVVQSPFLSPTAGR